MKKYIKYILILLVLWGGYQIWSFVTGPLPDYYEYPAESASDCKKGELFDVDDKVCYFSYFCVTEEECLERDKQYGQILDDMASQYKSGDAAQYMKAKELLEGFNDGPQIAFNEDVKIKNIMKALLPNEHLERIHFIKNFSDGLGNILAYVHPVSTTGEVGEDVEIDGSHWELVYDREDCFTTDDLLNNPREFLSTFIHEYAHILSLNETQVNFGVSQTADITCEEGQLRIQEGCLLESAYLTTFIKAFWTEDNYKKAEMAQAEGDFSFADELYTQNANDYITLYAASNPVEDFAETFAHFVLGNKPTDDTKVKNKKILSCYNYPELKKLRNKIRGGVLAVLRANKK